MHDHYLSKETREQLKKELKRLVLRRDTIRETLNARSDPKETGN